MAAGVWTIRELRPNGSAAGDAEGEVFVWSSDDAALVDSNGGARAAPQGNWTIGVKLNTKATQYPGTTRKSEQVMSAEWKDQAFTGRLLDKYNYRGYAVREARRFQTMVRRGNRVQISFQSQAFEGLIVDLDFPYRGDFEIRYTFKISVHGSLDDDLVATLDALNALPKTPTDPTEALTRVDVSVQALIEANDKAPRPSLLTRIADDIEGRLEQVASARDSLASTLDILQSGPVSKLDQWRKIGDLFRDLKRSAADLGDATNSMRTDAILGWQSVQGFFDLEEWMRDTRYFAASLMGDAELGAQEAETRSKPKTLRTYWPQVGESLYAIAQRYYGSPFAWRFIADRNGLDGPICDGTAPLILPERTS